jgi:hypothetical protein
MELIFSNAIENIDAIYDFTLRNAANEHWRIDIGLINGVLANNIFENTNLELENYLISVDTHGIRHILRQHGTIETEKNRGQKVIQKKELRLLIKTIQQGDSISDAGKSALGNDCILLQKEIKGILYFSIWEVRKVTSVKKQSKKKSRIMLQTLYGHQSKKPS